MAETGRRGVQTTVMKAQSRANRKYNDKTYSRVLVDLPKELVAEFKEKCKRTGTPQAQVLRQAIEEFVKSVQ